MRGPPRRELRNDSTCCKTPPRRLHPTSRLYFFVSAFSESAGDTTRFENALEAPSMLNLNGITVRLGGRAILDRSEEHTSELQSLMRISYAVFCLKKKKTHQNKCTHISILVHEYTR